MWRIFLVVLFFFPFRRTGSVVLFVVARFTQEMWESADRDLHPGDETYNEMVLACEALNDTRLALALLHVRYRLSNTLTRGLAITCLRVVRNSPRGGAKVNGG